MKSLSVLIQELRLNFLQVNVLLPQIYELLPFQHLDREHVKELLQLNFFRIISFVNLGVLEF